MLSAHTSTSACGVARAGRSCAPATGSSERSESALGPVSVLGDAIELLAGGRPEDADLLLTAAVLETPDQSDLWLAAGIARLRRGMLRSAAAALRMCVWISDDPLARDLLWAIDG